MVAREEFSALLKELKARSGLSYGVLARRLHLSTSTLHRYVNGGAVPTDYAPVERFARLCKATPEELLRLHQLWVTADVLRRSRPTERNHPGPAPEPAPEPASHPAPERAADPAPEPERAPDPGPALKPEHDPDPEPDPDSELDPDPGLDSDPEPDPMPEPESASDHERPAGGAGAPQTLPAVSGPQPPAVPARRRHRRSVMLAGLGLTAAAVAAALVASLAPDPNGDDSEERQPAAGPALDGISDQGSPSSTPTASEKADPATSESASPSNAGASTEPPDERRDSEPSRETGAAAPTVTTDPYRWENPCSQHYLVNRPPEQVPPPPTQQDARGWAVALGAVPSNDQLIALTVQGTGPETVVLEELHVRVVNREQPLAWNDYAMGVGCGGDVSTTAFDVDLDSPQPGTTPVSGQRDFPYQVSESDPEVFYLTAHTRQHQVSWYLELDWSSGERHGTVRIDDDGEPFRTSANRNRPAYAYPLGTSAWSANEG